MKIISQLPRVVFTKLIRDFLFRDFLDHFDKQFQLIKPSTIKSFPKEKIDQNKDLRKINRASRR